MVLNDIKVQIIVSSGKCLFHTWVFLKDCLHLYFESFHYNLPLWCNVIAFLRFYQTSSDIKWVKWQISWTKFVFVYRFQVSLRISIFCTHTITFFGESRLPQDCSYFAIETDEVLFIVSNVIKSQHKVYSECNNQFFFNTLIWNALLI
jgi:hypothetical protein